MGRYVHKYRCAKCGHEFTLDGGDDPRNERCPPPSYLSCPKCPLSQAELVEEQGTASGCLGPAFLLVISGLAAGSVAVALLSLP